MKKYNIKKLLIDNSVPILFILFCALAVPVSGFSAKYLIQEIITRLGRNSFLLLSLLIPIIAGMGLNFGIVLGAMAGQIGLILITDRHIVGMSGLVLAMIISTPIAILLGYISGVFFNKAKGREMVTGMILSFFFNGIYLLFVLYAMGPIIPIVSKGIILSRGYGIRTTVGLDGIRQTIDNIIPLDKILNGIFPNFIMPIQIPIGTFILVLFLCLFIIWFRKTKLGQDMRAIGQNMHIAESAGINVDRTRIISIIISTVLACYGQIIFLQNMGTISVYSSHMQTGTFAIAALLVGGASVNKATIPNVFLGILLFHTMFIVAPMAGKQLIGEAQIGEFLRTFVSYGVIAIALVLYAYKLYKEKELKRLSFRGEVDTTNK